MKQQKRSRGTSMVPVTTETIQIVQSVAPIAQASRMYDVTEDQAALIMLKGWELGLGLTTSFEFIDVINDRPSLKPKGAIALIQSSGELDEMVIEDLEDKNGNPTACRVYMKRTNGFAYEVTFSMEDAERAGLIKPDGNWEKYPGNMLRWRAIGYCADIVFPDAIGGLYRPEELGAEVTRSGAPVATSGGAEGDQEQEPPTIDVTPKVKSAKEESEDETEVQTLEDLISHGYTAAEVLEANDGRIPGTPEDCQRVFEELEAASA